jgi:hypothetical protein
MMRRIGFLLLAGAVLPTASCALVGIEFVDGSGTPATEHYAVNGFKAVNIHSAFEVEITRADEFDVSVTTDDNLLQFVKVVENGGTLTVSLEPGKNVRNKTEMTLKIAMPDLESVKLSGACKGQFKGFKAGKRLSIEVNGASTITGDVETGELSVVAEGASGVTLHGKARDALVEGSGASHLHLNDVALGHAVVHLSGASTGKVNVKDQLDFDVSGASHLTYRGHPTLGDQERSGASSVTQD